MGLFNTKTKTKLLMLPEARESLKGLLETSLPGAKERLSRAGEAYGGELTAGLSDPEKTGLDTLEGWLGSPSPTEDSLYGLSRQEYEKTLGSDYYDPAEGQYYQAYRAAMQRELQEARDRLASTTSARDSYYGGGRIATEGEMEEDYLNELGVFLGGLTERERERRLGAIPGAMDLLGRGEGFQENRVAASQEYGALPREIEQAGLDREYQEYIRQMEDLGIPLDIAMQLTTFKPDWSVTQEGGEGWDLLGALAGGVGAGVGLGGISSLLGGGGGGLLASGGFKSGMGLF